MRALAKDDDTPAGGLEAVFLQNRAKLRSFLLHSGAGDIADDLLQEVWLRLSRLDRGPIAEPRSYLFRMAYNLLLDQRRGSRRTALREREWSEATGPTEPGISDQPATDRALVAREALSVAEQRLTALGEPTSGIFRRHRVDGRTQRAIAAEYGISISTVEKHLRRAYALLHKLRETIGEV
ncbi:MAG TPA: RNA polymerase sigma factor [Vicinamibacterales bacterium]